MTGATNSYTAEFWQYDPRLGRRWNMDPMGQHPSPYMILSSSPTNGYPDGGYDEPKNGLQRLMNTALGRDF